MMTEVSSIDLQFHHQDLKVFIPVVGGLLGIIIFWFTQKSDKIQQRFLDKYGYDQGSAKFIIFTKYLGGFTIGILPLMAYCIAFPQTTLSQLGLGFPEGSLMVTILWSAGLMALVIPLIYYSAKKMKNKATYPQIRARLWDQKMLRNSLAAWAAYLLGYEILFRGLMFFPLLEAIGLWPTIAVNIALYSGTHIPKGLDETLGAIVLAIIFCLLSLLTGTIWIAFFVHTAMAWTNNLTAVKYHPDMVYKRSM